MRLSRRWVLIATAGVLGGTASAPPFISGLLTGESYAADLAPEMGSPFSGPTWPRRHRARDRFPTRRRSVSVGERREPAGSFVVCIPNADQRPYPVRGCDSAEHGGAAVEVTAG